VIIGIVRLESLTYERSVQDVAQPFGGGMFAPHRGHGNNPIGVGECVKVVRLLVGPAIAEEAGHGDLKRVG
jgi:hypothetical protein